MSPKVPVPEDFKKKLQFIFGEGRDGFPKNIGDLSKLLYGEKNRAQLANIKGKMGREKHALMCMILETSLPELALNFDDFCDRRTGGAVLEFKNRGFNRVAMSHQLRKAYAEICDIGHDLPDNFALLAKREWLRRDARLCELDIDNVRHRWFTSEERRPVDQFRLPLMNKRSYETWVQAAAPGTRFEDLPAYRLTDVHLDPDGRVQLDIAPSKYGDFANTCGVLEIEFAQSYQKSEFRGLSPLQQLRECRLRMDTAGQLRDPLDLRWRNAVPGVNTLLVLVHVQPGQHHFFYHDRTPKGPAGQLAEAQGTKHVVPAGTFQSDSPMEHHSRRDRRLERTVWREFSEELIGEDLVKSMIGGGKDFLEHPLVARFHELRAPRNGASPAAQVFYLGMGLDALTLKPEILTLMVVDARRLEIPQPDGSLRKGLTDLNTEIPLLFGGNWEGKFAHEQMSRSSLTHFIGGEDTLPAGAAAMHLALLRLEEIEALYP